jgi:hygromycin-B 7''-O-kinase
MSFQDFKTFRADTARWTGVALDIARSHGMPVAEPHPFEAGSNLILGLDADRILKIYPPMLRHQFVSERASLRILAGRLSVPIPEILAEGERDGWPYLIFTRLKGVNGEVAWPTLSESEKESVLGQIGALIAEVQRVPAGELLELEPKWSSFIPKQIEGCRTRHERLKLDPRYLAGLEHYLKDAPALFPTDIHPVILTGEYIPENFLLERASTGWNISGLIDFGDVMTGFSDYDLIGPSTYMAGGMPGRVRCLLAGYGYGGAELDRRLSRRLMTLLFLHRFSDLEGQVRIEDWKARAPTLGDLERLLWPI